MDKIEGSSQLTLLDSAASERSEAEDSNHGIEEGAVATRHESAQTNGA